MAEEGLLSSNNEDYIAKIKHYLWFIPLMVSILIPFACLSPYVLNVYVGKIDPLKDPYMLISDAASISPGANLFAQLVDIASALFVVMAWIRFKQIRYYLFHKEQQQKQQDPKKTKKMLQLLNLFSFLSVVISFIGFTMAGNFDFYEYQYIHLVNCSIAAPFLIFYVTTMTYITWNIKLFHKQESWPLTMGIATISILATFVIAGMAIYNLHVTKTSDFFKFVKKYMTRDFRLKWATDDSEYLIYVVFCIAEYVTLCLGAIFMLSLTRRFRKFKYWQHIHL